MNKIDRDAFHKWDSSRAKTAHANIQAWEAACTYKDKRIAELKAEFVEHLVYLHDNYPDVYQDPAIPAFEDYESEGGADD